MNKQEILLLLEAASDDYDGEGWKLVRDAINKSPEIKRLKKQLAHQADVIRWLCKAVVWLVNRHSSAGAKVDLPLLIEFEEIFNGEPDTVEVVKGLKSALDTLEDSDEL